MSDPAIQPILIKAGKRSKKAIKKLKRGGGSLLSDVQEAVSDTLLAQGSKAAPSDYLTVVILVAEKPKKRRRPFGFTPLFPLR